MNEPDLPLIIVSAINVLASVAFFVWLILFFFYRRNVFKYIFYNFTETQWVDWGIGINQPTRYAKWGRMFQYADEHDQQFKKLLKRFRICQIGAGDAFMVWLAVEILYIWFFKQVI